MPLTLDDLALGAALVFAVAVAVVDMRTHKIPNVLCLVAAIAGLVLQLGQGWHGASAWLSGLATGFVMFIPFYALRAFGAGDVKAMAAVGGFLGAKLTALAVGFTLVAGCVLGVAVLCVTSRSMGCSVLSTGRCCRCADHVRQEHDDTNRRRYSPTVSVWRGDRDRCAHDSVDRYPSITSNSIKHLNHVTRV